MAIAEQAGATDERRHSFHNQFAVLSTATQKGSFLRRWLGT